MRVNIQSKTTKGRVFSTPFLLLLYIANILVMDKQLLIDKINGIQNPVKEKQTIYEVLTALNIPFKKTSCSRCINDLLNIAKEELGLIGNAAEVSDFNTEKAVKTYQYIHNRAVLVNGKKYGVFSSQSDLEELYKLVGLTYVSVV